MAKKEDRRIQKSRKHIKHAFTELIQEKGLGEISVHEIAEKADINRGTFYLHYQDKYDLFEKYVDELLDELIMVIEPSNQEKRKMITGEVGRKRRENYQQFFKHFQMHACFYQAMFSYKGGPYFYDRFLEELKKYFCREFKAFGVIENNVKVEENFLVNFIVYAFFGVVKYWFASDMSDSPETMGDQLDTLLCSMFQSPL